MRARMPPCEPCGRRTVPTDVLRLLEPGLTYVRRRPCLPAAGVVAESWTIQARRCPTAIEGLVAGAGAQVYFNLGPHGRGLVGRPALREAHRSAWIVGPRAAPLRIWKETERSDIVAASLHPAATMAVLGTPGHELRDRMVDLGDLWGPGRVERIRARLAACGDPGDRLTVIETALLRRAHRSRVAGSLASLGRLCVALTRPRTYVGEIAETMGLTHRRLIEVVTEHMGLKPKELHRVARFRTAVRRLEAGGDGSARVAHACGYHDQPHLIREFRRLSGLTPGEYRRRRNPIGSGFVRLEQGPR